MAALKRLAGPVALSNTLTTNIYNPASALIIGKAKHLHVSNKTAGAVTFTLYLGATGANAAGTELYVGESVPANTAKDYYFSPGLKFSSTDFLVGGASAATSLTLTLMGEEEVVLS